MTPVGNPANVGVVVATPAVPAPGTAVAAWMCALVVVPVRLENAQSIASVWSVLL